MGRSRLNTAHALRFAHRQHVGATAPHRGSPLHPQFLPRKDIKIAHVVARHSSESIVYKKWFPFPLMVHFLRRMEIEADHIGMLLMAAAGFDPHIAPMVLEKQGNDIYHPSGKKRAQLLSRAKVMDEALELYREVMPAKAPEV